jgi:hypothetical protein
LQRLAARWGLPLTSELPKTKRYDLLPLTRSSRDIAAAALWVRNWLGGDSKWFDFAGLALRVDIKRIQTHVLTQAKQERAGYIHNLQDLIESPHEAWMMPDPNSNNSRLYLLRYYRDDLPLIAVFDLKGNPGDQLWRFNTMFANDEFNANRLDLIRRGLLIAKK